MKTQSCVGCGTLIHPSNQRLLKSDGDLLCRACERLCGKKKAGTARVDIPSVFGSKLHPKEKIRSGKKEPLAKWRVSREWCWSCEDAPKASE